MLLHSDDDPSGDENIQKKTGQPSGNQSEQRDETAFCQ